MDPSYSRVLQKHIKTHAPLLSHFGGPQLVTLGPNSATHKTLSFVSVPALMKQLCNKVHCNDQALTKTSLNSKDPGYFLISSENSCWALLANGSGCKTTHKTKPTKLSLLPVMRGHLRSLRTGDLPAQQRIPLAIANVPIHAYSYTLCQSPKPCSLHESTA